MLVKGFANFACLFRCTIIVAAISFTGVYSQNSKADSGWVSIFNGTDFDGLYVYSGGQINNNPGSSHGPFSIRVESGDTVIHVSGGGGHIATKEKYSRYHFRVTYKFGSACTWRPGGGGTRCNAGIMYHTDDALPKMNNHFPRSIECQMYQGNTGDFISIYGPVATIPYQSNRWNPSGNDYTQSISINSSGSTNNGNAINYQGRFLNTKLDDDESQDAGGWNTLEIAIHANDSAIHIVNGDTALKAYNIRYIYPNDDPLKAAVPLTEGTIALQAEGAVVQYKHIEVRPLLDDGRVLIRGCTNPSATNYSDLATVDDSSCVVPVGVISKFEIAKIIGIRNGNKILLEYSLPQIDKYHSGQIVIYSMIGQKIKSFLVHKPMGTLVWESGSSSEISGMYFVTFKANEKEISSHKFYLR